MGRPKLLNTADKNSSSLAEKIEIDEAKGSTNKVNGYCNEIQNYGDADVVENGISQGNVYEKFSHLRGIHTNDSSTASLDNYDDDQSISQDINLSLEGKCFSDNSMCLPIEEAKSRWKAEGKHENANINVTSFETDSLSSNCQSAVESNPAGSSISKAEAVVGEQAVAPKKCRGGERRASSRRNSPAENSTLASASIVKETSTPSHFKPRQHPVHKDQDCTSTNSEAVSSNRLEATVSAETRLEVQRRLSSFEHIATNKFICER